MGNCLKTQLKESVSNSNLDYLGYSKIHVSIPQDYVFISSKYIAIAYDSAGTLKIEGDGYFKDTYNGSNIGTSLPITNTDINTIYLSAGNYTILFEKYKLKFIETSAFSTNVLPDLDFQYLSSSLTSMDVQCLYKETNISGLSSKISLSNIRINGNLIGSINSLGDLIGLRTMYLNGNAGISGNVSKLLNTMWTNGKRTSIQIARGGSIESPEDAGFLTTYNFDDNGWSIGEVID